MKKYPQVRKTGVDAVHEENVICNVCNDDGYIKKMLSFGGPTIKKFKLLFDNLLFALEP